MHIKINDQLNIPQFKLQNIMVNHIYINQESQTWITINLVGLTPFKIYPYYVFLHKNFELSGALEKFLKAVPISEYKFHVSMEKI